MKMSHFLAKQKEYEKLLIVRTYLRKIKRLNDTENLILGHFKYMDEKARFAIDDIHETASLSRSIGDIIDGRLKSIEKQIEDFEI